MSTKPEPARVHLLPAKSCPYVLIIRRKPSKVFHVILWNTKKNTLESGSWFKGKLYPMRCDISPDGKWMVYLAMGSNGETWNGICKAPWLKTYAESKNMGTWFGGGFWDSNRVLKLNAWSNDKAFPFKTEKFETTYGGEDEGVLFPRMIRDGWLRAGENWGVDKEIYGKNSYQVECNGDDGWMYKPTKKHPTLRTKYIGYFEKGRTFLFSIDEYPELLDKYVEWATWDYLGNLVYSRLGVVNLYKLSDLKEGKPTYAHDLEHLAMEI